MNTPLRDEILRIIRQPRLNHVEVVLDDLDIAQEILNLIASKMPEKKNYPELNPDIDQSVLNNRITGFNKAITEVKSILKGGTDEH